MADELNIGLNDVSLATLVARIYNPAMVQVGADIAMAEVTAGEGRYTGSVPAATLATNEYEVLFYNTAPAPDSLLGRGTLLWDGPGDRELESEEILREVFNELGLNPAVPKTNTEITQDTDFDEVAGAISSEIRKVGNGVGSVVTKTRTSVLP